jgi:hypothetical protein
MFSSEFTISPANDHGIEFQNLDGQCICNQVGLFDPLDTSSFSES